MSPYTLTPTVEREGVLNGVSADHTNGATNGATNGDTTGYMSEHFNDAIPEPRYHSVNGSTSNSTHEQINDTVNEHTNGHHELPALTTPVQGDSVIEEVNNGTYGIANDADLTTSDSHVVDNGNATHSHTPVYPQIDKPTTEPPPTIPYEGAYTHGYTEGYATGYAKSHTALKHQPIAIIGMSCRFPGNVSTPDEFWELCARARTGFTAIPKERFDSNRFFHPNPGKGGTTNARGGNFLQADLSAFDAPFFSFTAQEATSLDPQQRLLLECTFEALEGAGIPKHSIVGTDVGCFIGGSFSEYEADLFRDPETIPMHQATGCAFAMQSNRISHFFDLRGPSFTVDTACSSSLVALHQACQSIRSGESSTAIVGAVHLNMLPEFWISMSMSRLFGEDGRSYAFDQRGTGYGRGEGCGLLVLKPLDQALKDNDPIRAVITGSGINQDGKTPGITMPNGSAQESLIRTVYRDGGMNPADCGYIEAHGTGTRVGDPIEVTALHNVFGEGRTKRKPLFIGSVKSNIGHLEAAAGIAGIIKTALMLERGFILPNYDFKQPNEKIPFDEWGLKVPVTQRPWPIGKKWASINGFGFGGTNAHIVLTKAPLERKIMKEEVDTKTHERLFVLTANDKVSIEKLMKNMGIYLEQRPEIFENDLLSNLAYTLGQRKSLLPWRVAISSSSSVSLVEVLSSGKIFPAKQELDALRLGFIFTGQGAQWWAMGRELYEQYPIYAAALDKADAHLTSIGASFSLLEELQKDEETTQINAAHLSQPSCTAVQLALTDLLQSWGVRPAAVAGHSSGEIGAAYAAGIINFEDAMTVAYHRGRLVPILKQRFPLLDGCMMAVGTGKDTITPLLDRIPDSAGLAKIACINSPSSVTISGDADAISELQKIIEEAHPGMFARKLQIDTAYHSHHMNLVVKDYTESLSHLQAPNPSQIRFHSSLLGRLADGSELKASYWVQNLTCAVRFDEAVQSMCQPVDDLSTGVNFLLELGPHAALQGPIKQIVKAIGGPAAKIAYSSALARKKNAVHTAFSLAGTLFVKGLMLDMGAINFPKPLAKAPAVLTDMPRYPWNHQSKFLHKSRMTEIHKYQKDRRSDIIGVLASYSNEIEPTWRNIVRLDEMPWLRHHQIQSLTIFPISGFVAMAIEAIAQRASWKDIEYDGLEVRDLKVATPAMLSDDDLEMTITLRASQTSTFSSGICDEFHICSWTSAKGWTEHCTGVVSTTTAYSNEIDGVRATKTKEARLKSKISNLTQLATEPVSIESMYENLSDIGVVYGPSFRGLHECRASDGASMALVALADTVEDMPNHYESEYVLHPTLLEQLMEMYWPILGAQGAFDTVHLPSSIGKISVSSKLSRFLKGHGSKLQALCWPSSPLSNVKSNKLSMFAVSSIDATETLIDVEDLVISPILERVLDGELEGHSELCYKLVWEPTLQASTTTNVSEELQTKDATSSAVNGNGSDVAAQKGHAPLDFGAEIVIVHGDTAFQHSLADGLVSRLAETTGRTPSTSALATVDGKDKLCIFLCEIDTPLLARLNLTKFEALQRLLTSVQGILWVVRGAYANSRNPDSNMIVGLSRTLRSEGTLVNFATLDLDAETQLAEADMVKTILAVFGSSLGADRSTQETEFMERAGSLFTPRIVKDEDMNEYVHKQVQPSATEPAQFTNTARPLRGSIATPGALDSIQFDEDDVHRTPLTSDQVEVQVKAIGITPRDLQEAMGHNSTDESLGMECSGVVTSVGSNVSSFSVGDRVAAITKNGSLSTVTRAHNQFLIKLPHHLSFEAAAAIPIAYSTAYRGLVDLAALSEGESILVHDAASAVGQAAVTIAQMVGAEVFVTVDSVEKKRTLRDEYGIAEEHIFFNGTDAFSPAVREATESVGVDVIINTFSSGEPLRATWACLANFGRFVNIGERDSSSNKGLDMIQCEKSPSVFSVDIAALALSRPQLLRRTLADVAKLLRYGKIRPAQPIQSFGISETAAALHALQAGDVNGKLVIVPREDELVLAPRSKEQINLLRADATYIIIGGTGGLGRSMAKWMLGRGAKHIVLLSRSGAVKGKAKEQIDELNTSGANIVVRRCNVVDKADVESLVSTGLDGLPPVRGLIHGAMVLNDVLFEKMTYDQYATVIESKVQGTWNFHHALSDVPLDFFVVISSAAGAVGNRGQAAYAAANTFLNGFTQYRIAKGLPAASIDLTAVSDAGYLAEDLEKATEVARNLGGDSICEAEVLALVGAAINGKMAATCNHHCITGMRITATMRPFWSEDSKFTHLLKVAEEAAKELNSGEPVAISWSAALKAATTRVEAEEVVCNGLVDNIAKVISMEKEELDVTRSLSHYPLDSLTAIEIRNFITRMFEANLQVLELLASGSIQTLAKAVCAKSKMALPAA
ncbi:BcPKS8, polyketide synthase [Pleomassaria siparia CBS 279.74]|uniref:BcPKS8, polyketide synthase n=1 Tax=Pleomassaria siparia CBS 279.74 TaxID=1314801 RepID=A0A6G1JX43_9PLEO|nr:BcPKS8, polyketide synthase [Pleomassaria siparia CBS 279.74]